MMKILSLSCPYVFPPVENKEKKDLEEMITA